MSDTEVVASFVANVGVCILCAVTTTVLIVTWCNIGDSSYPRWTLGAIGMLYLGYSIRRLLNVFAIIGHDLERILVIWDCISFVLTSAGMVGEVYKARWVITRMGQYRLDVAKEKAVIEEMNIKLIEKDTRIKMFETVQALHDSKIIYPTTGTA